MKSSLSVTKLNRKGIKKRKAANVTYKYKWKNLNKSQENPQYIHSDKVGFIVEGQG